jgi:hypothetical protein
MHLFMNKQILRAILLTGLLSGMIANVPEQVTT